MSTPWTSKEAFAAAMDICNLLQGTPSGTKYRPVDAVALIVDEAIADAGQQAHEILTFLATWTDAYASSISFDALIDDERTLRQALIDYQKSSMNFVKVGRP